MANYGKASIGINLNPGTYKVTVNYKPSKISSKIYPYTPSSTTNTIKVLTTIIGKNITKTYKNETQYTAKFLDKKGKPLKNTFVEFNIYGVFYKRQTNSDGVAKLNINLNPEYTANI